MSMKKKTVLKFYDFLESFIKDDYGAWDFLNEVAITINLALGHNEKKRYSETAEFKAFFAHKEEIRKIYFELSPKLPEKEQWDKIVALMTKEIGENDEETVKECHSVARELVRVFGKPCGFGVEY